MAKNKLTVKTDVGTFTRTTARTYTHVVVAKGYRAEILEASRLAAIAEAKRQVAEYSRIVETNDPTIGARKVERDGNSVARDWDIKCHTEFIADGSYAKWLANSKAEAARLEALGPITADANSWGDFGRHTSTGEPATWQVLGWCGRADLAGKLADSKEASKFRDVRVYAVDGTRVS